jgi:hypothetical protein
MPAGSLALFAPAMMLAAATLAAAQQPPPPPAPAPSPAPAALSVPDPLVGFRPGPRDLYRSPDGSDRFRQGSLYPAPPIATGPVYPVYQGFYPGPVYPGGYYPFAHPYGPADHGTSLAETYRMSMAENYLRRQRERARGGLVLHGVSPSAHVFVDGHYVGLAQDFEPGTGVIALDAGPHHVELRAAGYETLAFSVRIDPNSLVRYQGDMQRLRIPPAAAGPAAAPAPAAAKSVYVIPNCYAGDRPPSGTLPKGCDVKKLENRK